MPPPHGEGMHGSRVSLPTTEVVTGAKTQRLDNRLSLSAPRKRCQRVAERRSERSTASHACSLSRRSRTPPP